MLSNHFTSVLSAQNPDDLRESVIRFAQQLGFDKASATVAIDQPARKTKFLTVDNTPPAYRDCFEDLAAARFDPVMQHCRISSLPIVWDQRTYVASGQGEKWERQAHHGYKTGIALALHFPQGRHFFIGVDRDQSLPSDASALTRIVADLQLFGVLAQEAALRVLLPAAKSAQTSQMLTPRELESLRWTMEGKTAWEVGKILSISEQTAVRHVNNAMHKLGCINKHQAVLKALRLGLIG